MNTSAPRRLVLSGSDLTLAARIEAAECESVLRIAQASVHSSIDVATGPFAGGAAIFAGPGSPMNHALGVGLRGDVSPQEMERLEHFFHDRGTACVIDLCPLAHPSVYFYLQSNPYRLSECNNIMVRAIAPGESFDVSPAVRRIAEPEYEQWSTVVCGAFSEQMPVAVESVAMMAATCKASECWMAGREEGAAAMSVNDGVAHFYGDSTIPSARRAGWHSALIRARLASAREQGCELAIASVLPGSQSHRNYERAGFALLYARVSLVREVQ